MRRFPFQLGSHAKVRFRRAIRHRITKPGTVTIFKEFPKVSFHYRISGNALSLTPLIPRGCTAFRCAWAIAVAYPGKTWKRAS